MDHAFWFARWQEGRIGFHEGQPNAFLVQHHEWLAPCRRILVPLCGKTADLAFLAGAGHEVVGVELVEDAVRQFFAEHDATPEIAKRDGFVIYTAGAITVLAGDVFATSVALVGAIDGIYDRAALVALPPDVRPRYVDHLRAIAPAAQRELLVSLEHAAGSAEGPPFSVDETEVRTLFASATVTLLGSAADASGKAGGTMMERCYAIELAAAA